MDEIASIKSEIELLKTRLAALELENASKQETQSGGDPVAFGTDESSPIEIAKLRAFDVTCDGRETDPWLVYLPDGCCKYGDFTPDAIQPEPDSTTHLADLQNDTKNGGIYAHLYLELDDDSDNDSSTEHEVVGFPLLSIDTTPTQTPSEDNIKVIDIKIATITDGAVAQNVSSALILGRDGGRGGYTPDPSPFQFTVVSSEYPETHEPTLVGEISNCKFYWDGVLKTLDNFKPPATCTVYICGTQDAPSSSDTDPDWEFKIATSEAKAPSGGRVVNYKLYDIDSNEVTMDYRTTFLELNSPHERAEIVVKKPDADESRGVCVIADASSDYESKIEVRNNKAAEKHISATVLASGSYFTVANGSQRNASINVEDGKPSLVLRRDSKKITLAVGDLKEGNEVKIHTLTVKDAYGNETKYDVLSDKDIEMFAAKGTVLKDVELTYDNYELKMKKTTIDLETGEETKGSFETVFTTEEHSAQS